MAGHPALNTPSPFVTIGIDATDLDITDTQGNSQHVVQINTTDTVTLWVSVHFSGVFAAFLLQALQSFTITYSASPIGPGAGTVIGTVSVSTTGPLPADPANPGQILFTGNTTPSTKLTVGANVLPAGVYEVEAYVNFPPVPPGGQKPALSAYTDDAEYTIEFYN